MSFLPGRIAATEGVFFREQSKAAMKLLKEKMDPQRVSPPAPPVNAHADTVPEILRHSLPTTPPGSSPPTPVKPQASPVPVGSSLAGVSQSIMRQVTRAEGPATGLTKGAGNDLMEMLSTSVPAESTFGPKRWNLEHGPGPQPVPSAANAARVEAEAEDDPPTQEEVREGMFTIVKAFGVATAIIFGSAAVGIGYLGYRLEWHSLEDVKTKSREAMAPRVESIRQWFKPTQEWAHQTGEKLKMEEAERQALGLGFAQSLGVQSTEHQKVKVSAHQDRHLK